MKLHFVSKIPFHEINKCDFTLLCVSLRGAFIADLSILGKKHGEK